MTNNVKYSWFLNQKGSKRAKNVAKRYQKKLGKLYDIKNNSNIFGIELSENSLEQIKNKIDFYSKQSQKLYTFAWHFEKKGKDEALKNIERYYEKPEIDKYKTSSGILKVLRKLF